MCIRRLRIPEWNWQFGGSSDFQLEAERLILIQVSEQRFTVSREYKVWRKFRLAMEEDFI